MKRNMYLSYNKNLKIKKMKNLFIVIFLLPAFCFSQKKQNGYAQINADFNISKPLGLGVGGSFGVGNNISQNASIGAGFDIIKYKNLEKVLPSLYADLRYYFGSGITKPLFYFTATPGFSFYKEDYNMRIGTTYSYYHNRGGFFAGAGFGFISYSGKKMAPFISVMYNTFPIKTFINNSRISTIKYDVAKISFGLKF